MLLPFHTKGLVEAGCDEAGRGCLAGPVVAAAVILPPDYCNSVLNDSKKLSALQRDKLRFEIEREALHWGVAQVSALEIDEINILNASFLAMHRALDKIEQSPEHVLVDGNRFKPYQSIKHTCIIKGDGKYLSIAAASVLAKTYRDEHMEALNLKYPEYKWSKNKGYPTAEHRDAIARVGSCAEHRMSFRLLPEQLKLPL